MDEKNFINEKIIGRRISLRRRLLHYLSVVLTALLFGCLSAAVFVYTEPIFRGMREPEETPSHIELGHTEESETETETETEPPSTEAETEAETEPIEEVVQSELRNYHFSISDYEDMMLSLRQIGTEAEASLVEVTKWVEGQDFLGDTAVEESYAGMILAVTDSEAVIFTLQDAVQDMTRLEVRFQRGNRYEATVKAVDRLDGIAVLSVPVRSMMERDRKTISAVNFGNSKALKLGDALITVGAPAGVLYSQAVGAISYLNYNQPAIDGMVEDIRANLDASYARGSFVLNTRGELVGFVTGRMGESESGYVRLAGISDFLSRLEILTNGRTVPYLGLEIQDVSAQMEQEGIPKGIYIRSVQTDSPAYVAGIQAGDVLVQIEEETLRSVDHFETELEKTERDATISLTVLRARGQEYGELTLQATVGER